VPAFSTTFKNTDINQAGFRHVKVQTKLASDNQFGKEQCDEEDN